MPLHQRLRGPVEFGSLVREAANQREHTTRMRIQRRDSEIKTIEQQLLLLEQHMKIKIEPKLLNKRGRCLLRQEIAYLTPQGDLSIF